MNTQLFQKRAQAAPIVITLLVAVLMAACAGPTPNVPTPQAAVPQPSAAIPITGPTSPALGSTTPSLAAPASTPLMVTSGTPQAAPVNAPAPACQKPATLTPAVTEGPYFKANSPERPSLVDAGMSGLPLTLTGYVLTTNCQPVAGALLDFWQANAQGQYDNTGYTLRGHQFTDAAGRYHLDTIVPGLYPGRTEHIHVKVQAPNGPILTTQLFFPGSASNQSDSIYDPALLVQVQSSGSQMQATFDFVINTR